MQPRTYRNWVEGKDLVPFTVTVKETDLYLRAASNLQRKTHRLVLKYRSFLERYIGKNPIFLTALEPIPISADAPQIVRAMGEAAEAAGVGPMAAVAGAIAEFVGRDLLEFTPEVIVENGGDIFMKCLKDRIVGIYAGESPLTGKIGIRIEARDTPLGVCTSSGTVGHSLSFGRADAVAVLALSAALADAAATAIGNRVSKPEDIDKALDFARGVAGLKGLVIIIGESIGVQGDIKLCETG